MHGSLASGVGVHQELIRPECKDAQGPDKDRGHIYMADNAF